MKYLSVLGGTILFALKAFAAPLDKATIPTDARWILHLDMDAFRQSKSGEHVTSEILEKKLTAAKEKLKLNLSLSFLNTASITIYGLKFNQPGEKQGILLLKSSADLKKDMDALMGLTAVSNDGKKITRLQENPYILYNLNDKGYVAIDVAGTAVLAKTREEVESACDVLLKKKENLSANENFSKLAAANGGFFFLGAVQGLSEAPVPPNAQVLKEANGGRLLLGEKGENLFLDLALQGKTAEAAMKIQQIFQGLIALGSLSSDKKELSDLANSAKVTSEGQDVRVQLEFPVAKALEQLDKKVAERRREK